MPHRRIRRDAVKKRTRRAHLLTAVREGPADQRAVDLEAANNQSADLEEGRVLLADLGQVVDGRARHVGEERVPRLGDEEAEDGEHGHAAVLGLGLAVAADVVVRRLGREAGRVPLAHRRERAGQVEAEALLGGEAGREAVLRLGDLVELALRELRRGDGLGRRRDERGRGRDGEGEGELGESHCCRVSAGGGAGQVLSVVSARRRRWCGGIARAMTARRRPHDGGCNVAPDTRTAAVERRAAAQHASLRNARARDALRHSQRASARWIALRVLCCCRNGRETECCVRDVRSTDASRALRRAYERHFKLHARCADAAADEWARFPGRA